MAAERTEPRQNYFPRSPINFPRAVRFNSNLIIFAAPNELEAIPAAHNRVTSFNYFPNSAIKFPRSNRHQRISPEPSARSTPTTRNQNRVQIFNDFPYTMMSSPRRNVTRTTQDHSNSVRIYYDLQSTSSLPRSDPFLSTPRRVLSAASINQQTIAQNRSPFSNHFPNTSISFPRANQVRTFPTLRSEQSQHIQATPIRPNQSRIDAIAQQDLPPTYQEVFDLHQEPPPYYSTLYRWCAYVLFPNGIISSNWPSLSLLNVR